MDKLELYKKAKEAYYSGEPIMGDAEFDALEAELGLENEGYVGDINSNYTVKHPCIMGSLSKVQVKEDKNHEVDWESVVSYIRGYVCKYGAKKYIVTPKFDGCSFEAVINVANRSHKIQFISSRGDGEKGTDLTKHLYNKVKDTCFLTKKISRSYMCGYEDVQQAQLDVKRYIVRGEVLIKKSTFEQKYKDSFANTRSFVAGLLNRKYDETDKAMMSQLEDLDIVVYDVKRYEKEDLLVDDDWADYPELKSVAPDYYEIISEDELEPESFSEIYAVFDDYRENTDYSLDGFVIKPVSCQRTNSLTSYRPKDCVAVKFKPQMQETEVIDIIWKLGKTGEYNPIIVVNPIEMDGKSITKASAFNYGYMLQNKISKGTKVVLSLAGDIIPYIYGVTDTREFSESKMNLSEINTHFYIDGVHLMADMSDEETRENKLFNSLKTLGIKGLGDSAALKIVEHMKVLCMGDEFFGIPASDLPDNALLITPEEVNDAIGGVTGNSLMKIYKEYLKEISLKEIIKTCNFKLCGDKVAEEIANYLVGKDADFSSKAKEAYEWAMDKESFQYKKLMHILSAIGYTLESFKDIEASETNEDEKIPVILTGEPNDYATKAEFIRCNPQYRVTTKWTEVKIVFTNSLESNTGKMKKAREKGIEIRLY